MTFKYRYRKQILLVGLLILLIGGLIISYFYFFKEEKETPSSKLLESTKKTPKKKENQKEKEDQSIMVDVKGEVNQTGIYTLKAGSRVIDAINMAGGLTTKADTSVLNLSKKLTDEMVIIVYSYYEVKNLEKTKEIENIVRENCQTGNGTVTNSACIEKETQNSLSDTKISINNATLEQLMTLTGIGEAKAQSIIEYRKQNGGFKTIEELKNVEGIGDALFDKIKENITL